MPTQETKVGKMSTEARFSMGFILVFAASLFTLLSIGLAKWRSFEDLSPSGPSPVKYQLGKYFPDVDFLQAVASFGDVVMTYWTYAATLLGFIIFVMLLIKVVKTVHKQQ